jgi:non-specific protein-tyrosine kinase
MDEAIQLKEKTYATLLDQYDQARVKEMSRTNMISVVEPAIVPLTPSKPNKVLNIGLGIIFGLIGGVGLAFLFENLFGSRLYSSKQIEEITELNTIGKIPSIERRRLVGLKNKKSEHYFFPFNEAFRRLHVQILLQNNNLPSRYSNKTFMITSSEPGEGKSTITSNLAIAIAQAGKKIIIVDCDLHIPKQHKNFLLPNTVGLSNLLNDPNTIGAVQKTRYPGLFVITSGPQSPTPAKMLGSPNMTTLIQSLAKEYDIVLMDSPAFLAVADTAQLAPIVDGVVLVVRRNQIREEAVREACRQLADIKARVIGLVVNEAERSGTYYYYGHK